MSQEVQAQARDFGHPFSLVLVLDWCLAASVRGEAAHTLAQARPR